MKEQAVHFIKLLVDGIASSPLHLWFTIGVVIATLPVTAVLVELYKRHHLKVNATELTNHGIDFVLVVTATLMSVADFLIANGTNMAHLLPFMAVVLPTIKAFAPTVYTYSKAIHGWMVNRKSEDQATRLKAVLRAADKLTTTQASGETHTAQVTSFGTAANDIDKSKLLQL